MGNDRLNPQPRSAQRHDTTLHNDEQPIANIGDYPFSGV
jgi:hypothetical protein